MCDKNVENASQWNKAIGVGLESTTTTASLKHATQTNMPHVAHSIHQHAHAQVHAHAHQHAHTHLYENVIYGDQQVYAAAAAAAAVAARYQPPASGSNAGTNVIIGGNSGSSGFVAPFPAAVAVATPTFPTTNINMPPNVANRNNTGCYGLNNLQHLNMQQQMELSKIMNAAINTQHAALPLTTTTTTTTNTTSTTTTTTTTTMMNVAATGSSITTTAIENNKVVVGGNIPNNIMENVLSALTAPPNASLQSVMPSVHGRIFGVGVTKEPDIEKLQRVQELMESGLSEHSKQHISHLLDSITALRPMEKLLLYLRLPGDAPETDPLRQPQNPLGTRTEINHTINWVRTHLEHDPQVSIPKQDVYDDYIVYCERLQIKPLSTADFGKVMKQVFPGIRPRRLGTRGHSRYCYAAMRKTSSLAPPQLPQLSDTTSVKCPGGGGVEMEQQLGSLKENELDADSWDVIQSWAEKVLHVKVDNAKELATRIKAQLPQQQQHQILTTHKKFNTAAAQQRELKEKRLLSDMGPLKKRRKKKRKGSSSSESSTTTATISCKTNNNDNNTNKNLMTTPSPKLRTISEGEQKPTTSMQFNTLNIKQEIMESPQSNLTPLQQQLQQYQHMPMNLAADKHAPSTPLTLTAMTTTTTISVPSTTTILTSAARNLTPKLLELSAQSTPQTPTRNINANVEAIMPVIKEETSDDYQTPAIFCKKVLKAHQTKGFWVNTTTNTATTSTLSNAIATTTTTKSLILPIITTTTASPPNTSVILSVQQQQHQQYLMGPPAHMANSISTSPLAVLSDQSGHSNNVGPKVASRNMLILRAKRQLAMAAAAAATTSTSVATTSGNTINNNGVVVEDASELPENLGLPRERVISICNMDKHELDDYFLPGQEEEEAQEDQDTELLQYFQTGDAEEKLNDSLDANKRNPTATILITTAKTTGTTFNNNNNINNNRNKINSDDIKNDNNHVNNTVNNVKTTTQRSDNDNILLSTTTVVDETRQLFNINNDNDECDVASTINTNQIISTTPTTKTTNLATLFKPTVGSASASLALLSQKHQLQQQQQNANQINNNNNKNKQRKIHINNNNVCVNERNKNRIFMPISPNINSPTTNISTAVQQSQNNDGSNLFASPGLCSRTLFKQQSLDNDDCSDPMIGANRRKRTFMSMATTSASAPPSPSLFQQQQQQQKSIHQNWLEQQQQQQRQRSDVASIINQNSLDMDLFETNNQLQMQTLVHNNNNNHNNATTTITSATTLADIETQRSQSVPLTQLQRIHSPLTKSKNNILEELTSTYTELNNNSNNACGKSSTDLQLEEACVVASDSTALLDEVDYSVMLSSPDFMSKFDCLAQTNTAATSTPYCSSAASSSGYSSSAYSCNVSRSVPSTPLPHQKDCFSTYYGQRRLQNSPVMGVAKNSSIAFGNDTKPATGLIGMSSNGNNTFAGYGYDISKSMPTTPITTPCFRYSPTEFSRDFLINGNTLDGLQHFVNASTVHSDSNSNGLVSVGMNVDSLIEDDGVAYDTFCQNSNNNTNDNEAILVGNSLLDSL